MSIPIKMKKNKEFAENIMRMSHKSKIILLT